MKKLMFLVFLFCCSCTIFAQNTIYRTLNIPAEKYGEILNTPWMGGMNAPQFSPIDLNQDGLLDLFAFDRTGYKVLTYLRKAGSGDTSFVYAPQYESLFPADLAAYCLVVDYNFDGIPDLFTRATADGLVGTRVLKGRRVNGNLKFDEVCPVLQFKFDTYFTNIYTAVVDVPVFKDVNNDGDIDVLTFGIFGSGVEYYENQHTENLGNPSYSIDSFKYEPVSSCWGNFFEGNLDNSITMNVTCKGVSGEQVIEDDGSRHSGSTIFAIDADNDRDVDLLLGDISFPNLVFVRNCGDSSYANVCQADTAFPKCSTPVNQPIFPAAYGLDIDNDGLEDLLISPNATDGANNIKNVVQYSNTGNPACPYQPVIDSFLVRNALDFGTDAKPVFFDYNYDGKMDLIVGNYGYFRPFSTYKSGLAILENIGTTTKPKFKLNTDDYNFLSNYNLVGMHPAFGDLDGDGKADMIIGELTGNLHFFKNTGGSIANFQTLNTPQYFGIDVGQYSAPFIYDLNGDSLNDLIVGGLNGKVNYYWNFGTPTSPQFNPDSSNKFLGNVNVDVPTPGFTYGHSTPVIHTDSVGNRILYVGANRGTVFSYLIDNTKLRSGTFQLLDSNFMKHDVGSKACMAVADLDENGTMEYVVGTSRGGLLFFSETQLDTTTQPVGLTEVSATNSKLYVFPNPAKGSFTCRLSDGVFYSPTIALYNILGEKTNLETNIEPNQLSIKVNEYTPGIYFLQVQHNNQLSTFKVMLY